tara:strand:+ start:1737 stop:2897 length:1161 start_codon:yes stop_codon:yes gene_type:complete
MSDEMGEIIAEQLSGDVVSNDNSQAAEVVDLTTPEPTPTPAPAPEQPVEATQETPQQIQQETPVKTESPVEQNNDRSLNTESRNQPVQERVQQPNASEINEGFVAYMNEQFGTEFKSVDEAKSALSPKELNFANEQIAQMNKFVGDTGRSIVDYLRTQTIDYTKMPNEDVMKVYMKQNNPDLTTEEVNLLITSKYKLGDKNGNETESKLGQIELKRDVINARKELLNLQEQYRMPQQNKGMSNEEANQIRENWLNNMKTEVNDVESLSFEINDRGDVFDFQLNDKHKESLVQSNSNLNNFFDRYVNKTGDWNFDKLNIDMFVLDNFQDIIRSVASQYRSKGTEQVIKDIKNPSFNNEPRGDMSSKKSIIEQLDDQINGGTGSLWNR